MRSVELGELLLNIRALKVFAPDPGARFTDPEARLFGPGAQKP